MDSRERRIRDLIAQLEKDIDGLNTQLKGKQADLRRYRDALDVWLEVDPNQSAVAPAAVTGVAPEDAGENRTQRFVGRKFLDCVRDLLHEHEVLSTTDIFSLLRMGGFESESANFRGVVSNMLNEAAKHGRLLKSGERLDATWRLPAMRRASLTNYVGE